MRTLLAVQFKVTGNAELRHYRHSYMCDPMATLFSEAAVLKKMERDLDASHLRPFRLIFD